MNHRQRLELISKIGRHLQASMTTVGINRYFATFKIQTPNETMANSKWTYVQDILAPVDEDMVIKVARDLGIYDLEEMSGSAQLKFELDNSGMKICRDDFHKALMDVDVNPPNSIGMASTTLESICKAILDKFEKPYPKDESLQPLLKAVFQTMDLSPDGHADEDLRRILGGLANVGFGLATLRTKYSSFHGKGSNQKRLEKRHARLAVNALTSVGMFLLETYLDDYLGRKVKDISNEPYPLPDTDLPDTDLPDFKFPDFS